MTKKWNLGRMDNVLGEISSKRPNLISRHDEQDHLILSIITDSGWKLSSLGVKTVLKSWISVTPVCNDDCYGWEEKVGIFICLSLFKKSLWHTLHGWILNFLSRKKIGLTSYKVMKWVRLIKGSKSHDANI